jgi:hypothetical protein
VTFLAIFSVWINRQALNTDYWTDTSSQMLEDRTIRDAVALYLVEELYANVDVANELKKLAPSEAETRDSEVADLLRQAIDAGAGPAAGLLRDGVERLAKRALATPQFQQQWEKANRVAHQELLDVINNRNEAVSTEGGVVTLDLRLLVEDIGDQLGIGGNLADKLPASAGQLVILESEQLDLAQRIARLIRRMAIGFTILLVVLYGFAIYVAHGRRRETLRATGIGMVCAGVAALVVRGLAGSAVVNSLATTEAVRPAAEHAWDIGTGLLVGIAASVIATGVLIVVVAWIGGPTRFALSLRRAAAPYLRERVAICYGVVAAILLVFIIWAPTASFHNPIVVLLYATLLVVGVEVLRRETAREFPDEPLAIGSVSEAFERASGAISRGASSLGGTFSRARAGAGSRKAQDSRLAQLERLASLKEKGALTDEEFEAEKTSIMRSDRP